ncbi:MAG: phosphate ABC transporter permease PstA [Chloroflexi bacterium]|nr:phosphate ABC transporter permease PstA [Chloroflexota bacterium]
MAAELTLARAPAQLRPTSGGRRTRAAVARTLTFVALLVALVPLLAVGSFIVSQGIGVIRPDFFLQDPPGDLSALGGGIRNAIVGTLEMTGIATAIAVPVGLLIAVFNAEVGGRLATAIRFVIDILAALPSIVVGIFVYELVVVGQGHFSALAGSIALAVIMLPLIVVSTEEMLRLTPRPVAEGVRALGMSRWRSYLAVLLPTALSGIFTGVLLAISRAIGETAPLLFTALGNNFFSVSLSEPMQGLPLLIYRNALNSAFPAARDRAMGAALVLIAIVLIFNLVGRWLVARRNLARR